MVLDTDTEGTISCVVGEEVVLSLVLVVLTLVGTAREAMSVGGGMPLTLAWPTLSTASLKMCGCSGGGGGEVGQHNRRV